LKELAEDIANVAQSRIKPLKKEIEIAEQSKTKAEAEIDMAKSAAGQVATFGPEFGGQDQCLYC
jgi:hypothetical protein